MYNLPMMFYKTPIDAQHTTLILSVPLQAISQHRRNRARPSTIAIGPFNPKNQCGAGLEICRRVQNLRRRSLRNALPRRHSRGLQVRIPRLVRIPGMRIFMPRDGMIGPLSRLRRRPCCFALRIKDIFGCVLKRMIQPFTVILISSKFSTSLFKSPSPCVPKDGSCF